MNIFLSSFRLINFAIQNFFRNFWLSFITITIFILTLLTINVVILMNVMADTSLKAIEQKVEVTVYFIPEASEDIVKAAQGYLLGLEQVREAKFISADDALADFKVRYANNEVILSSVDEVGGKPFGPELVISVHDSEDFPFILEAVDTPEFAPLIKRKDFEDFEDTIAEIKKISQNIRYAGMALAGFFGLVAMMIIFNTIRVAIYVHRDEIGIMKLVGANDWFVKGPFLIEAIMYAVIASIIVFSAMAGILSGFESWANGFYGSDVANISSYFIENGFMIFGLQFIGIVLLSIITTSFAMRKYLRV